MRVVSEPRTGELGVVGELSELVCETLEEQCGKAGALRTTIRSWGHHVKVKVRLRGSEARVSLVPQLG